MRRPTITQKDYLEAAQLFHWATRGHYLLWFTGSLARHRRTEVMLPRLVEKGKLVAVPYGKQLVYTVPRRAKNAGHYRKVEHGLAVTEGLVRLWRSRQDTWIIPERRFYGLGAVPEFGLWYPNHKLLLYEYCSRDNFERTGRMVGKLSAYQKNLPNILERFNAQMGIVIFVIDTTAGRIKSFLSRLSIAGLPFYFVDSPTFRSVDIGEQLNTPIYIWGDDQKIYPLSHD